MQKKNLSASLEDYLLAIYRIAAKKSLAHANQVAQRLDVAKSSVSWALTRLAEKDLINYAPYEAITLTPKGQALGRRLDRRHHAIEAFLTDVLALNPQAAHETACKLEHVLDPDILHRMREFMDFLETCPRAGREWMQGFGFFCDHGRIHQNCKPCIEQLLDNLPPDSPQREPSDEPAEPLPKRTKTRDQNVLQRLNDILAESGAHPLSPAQAHVVETFMATEKHLTPDDLLLAACKENHEVSLADVHEALAVLTEHKLARALRFRDRTLYEHFHPESHHDHLYCVRCGAIVEFFDPRIESLQVENARRADFRLLAHNLHLYGVCHDCIRSEADTRTLDQTLPGERVQITRVSGDPQTRKRIADLGLTPGAVLQVLNHNCAGGNVLLLVADSRLMIDPQTASQLRIRSLPTQHIPPPPGRHRARHRHAIDKPQLPNCQE